MDNKNQQIQNTVNMMAECLRDNANAHLLAVLVGDGATFTMGGNVARTTHVADIVRAESRRRTHK